MKYCGTDDAKELSEMAWDIWTDYYGSFITGDDIEYILKTFQTEEAIEKQILEGYLYSFIMCGGVKAGYLSIRQEGDSLFMSKLYVHKDFRGKGVGSKAMDDILEEGKARNVKKIYLRVNRNNLPSIEFYKYKGFVISKEEKV
ncbi:MAG: GNAT family N-acetyltransferase, partial [Methanomassiliicoccaceae archaeon]|nr:GNAT family N-acetyltransferase [Methanomassiliicoccaceae archaeon]